MSNGTPRINLSYKKYVYLNIYVQKIIVFWLQRRCEPEPSASFELCVTGFGAGSISRLHCEFCSHPGLHQALSRRRGQRARRGSQQVKAVPLSQEPALLQGVTRHRQLGSPRPQRAAPIAAHAGVDVVTPPAATRARPTPAVVGNPAHPPTRPPHPSWARASRPATPSHGWKGVGS